MAPHLNILSIFTIPNAPFHPANSNSSRQNHNPHRQVSVSPNRFSHTLAWPCNLNFVDWTTFKANGANLGGWLEVEQVIDPTWWNQYAPNAPDELTFCQTLSSQCGPVLEKRYASFITTADIDNLAAVGVNTLRIPTTYAAWVVVPRSQFYHGNQQTCLQTITNYAITKYGMQIIIGLHSLPGGVNSLDIGKAIGHNSYTTNLAYSFKAIDAVLSFIQISGHMGSFTLAPLNEASDNLAGVLTKIAPVDKRIPLMLQDCFQAICRQASALKGDSKYPVSVGEWSLQTMYNNTYANRKTLFDTQRYAWATNAQGGAFWTAKFYGDVAIDGQGTQGDYWNFEGLINSGVITTTTNASYC
ncbi:glycoside hydrolase [Acephala macrosclerotiorum]|nr:glycoside hydrolase [Acephala macrosclerotiorum]